MRLTLEFPSSWSQSATSATRDGIDVTWFCLELAPDDPRAWVHHELAVDNFVREEQTTTTAAGWPLLLIDASVGLEHRLIALLPCFEQLGVVIARSTKPLPDEVRVLIRTARPIVSDAPSSLAELVADLPARDAVQLPSSTAPIAQPIAPVSLEQIAVWETSPDDVDAWFNAGLAHYGAGRFEAAYEDWMRARDLAPDDFDVAHKLVQALFALGRDTDAALALEQARELWRNHPDPAIRARAEVVIDQRVVDGRAVRVLATLRPRDLTAYALTTFRTVDGTRPAVIVRLETSDYARLRGTPFVLSVECDGRYRVVGSKAELPPYRALVETAAALIRQSSSHHE
jgi:tetratricopeptide (TPR) repeat protein